MSYYQPLIVVFFIIGSAFSQQTMAATGSPLRGSLKSDFTVHETSEGLLPANRSRRVLQASLDATDCRAQLEHKMCLVEPRDKDATKPRKCLPGGEVYAKTFQELHDHFPPVLQKVFCSIDAIYIEKDFPGTAYADGAISDGTFILGIRQSVLDENLSLNQWASWKEQLSFGGATADYQVSPVLPQVATTPTPGVNSFLYFVVAHEFGHFLDFANNLNALEDPCPKPEDGAPPPECRFKPNTWGALSWESTLKPKAETDFANRAGLCFYWCEGKTLSASVVPQMYEDLVHKSRFLSAYASQQAWDDFADSIAYYMTDKELQMSYVLDTRQGTHYDIMEKLRGPLFAEKYEYIQQLLQRSDLKYP